MVFLSCIVCEPDVRGALPPSALPGISTSRGEIGKRLSCRFILKLQDGRDIAADRSPPLRGRCPAGQRGGKAPHTLDPLI
ncbi:hypothetical protein C2E26_11600 [Rhizobium sp. YIC5082]|nr:hypothetical protein C2E26_11600 [Rhizobium sp. YIC5082]